MPPLDALRSAPSQLTTLVNAINWNTPSWDLFILLFFIIAALLYGFLLGRERISMILVSVYMSLAVIRSLPFTNQTSAQLGIEKVFLFQICAFLGIFVILFFFLSRSTLLVPVGIHHNSGVWWHVIFLSFLHVGLIISSVLSFLPRDVISALAPWTQTVFVSDIGQFVWVVAPIIALIMSLDTETE